MPLVITSRHGGGRRLALTGLGLAAGMAFAGLVALAAAPKFFPDDPLAREPEPADASRVEPFPIHLSWDLISSLFVKEGDHARRPAQDINTIGEVPDSSWFTNRAGSRPLTEAEVGRGPDTTDGPAPGPWTVISGKSEGIRPGFTIRDSAGIDWFLKFDPPGYPEQATAAEVVSTKLFWALGYHVAETHVAPLSRANLRLAPDAHITVNGKRRALTAGDISRVLVQAARSADGTYQALASRRLEGKPVGEFLYYGTRSDDPNDVVPHEHRRELRGMVLAAAWIDRVDAKAGNTLDTLVSEGGRTVVRHHVLDFGSTLGSAGIGPNEYWEGQQYLSRRTHGGTKALPVRVPSRGLATHFVSTNPRRRPHRRGSFRPAGLEEPCPQCGVYPRRRGRSLLGGHQDHGDLGRHDCGGREERPVQRPGRRALSDRDAHQAPERHRPSRAGRGQPGGPARAGCRRRLAIPERRGGLRICAGPDVLPHLLGDFRQQHWRGDDITRYSRQFDDGGDRPGVAADQPRGVNPDRSQRGGCDSPAWATPARLYFRRGQTSWTLVGLERSAVATR